MAVVTTVAVMAVVEMEVEETPKGGNFLKSGTNETPKGGNF
jgi:hypothetical protein